MIVKAEHTALGSNPRFMVTNLPGTDDYLYDRVYCARGDMENRLKDQQRSGVLSPFRGQPVLAVIVGFGLYLDRGVVPLGTGTHGARHGPSEPHPPDLAADRGGGAAPYPPHPDPAEQYLPALGAVPYSRRFPGHLLTIAECCPGTLTNNGGKQWHSD